MGLRETADLAADLTKLVEAEQHSRIALQSALEQVQTAHAVQSRFAERLTGELTEPLRTLSALMGRIQVGHVLDAGAIIEAQEALTRIEGRLSASVAFNQHSRSRASTDLAVHLPTWTEAVVRGLEQRAAEHGVRLMAQADDTDVQINVQLLMPLLIHLVSNAINATSSGLDVTLCAQVSGRFVSFTVIDQGLGMPPQLLASLRMACARGEVMPGEPGIGFGLSLVIERSAQLGGHLEILRSDAHGTHIRLTIELIPR